MDYGQFCPVSKAAGLLGEKWALLIIRDLLGGSSRFREFQFGMPKISPTVLTRRLNELCEAGLIARKKIKGQRSHEYVLTPAGRDLEPIIVQLGTWGMQWARSKVTDEEMDVYLLMIAFEKRIDVSRLPESETVLQFDFDDIDKANRWWIVVRDGATDLCEDDPGSEPAVYIRSDRRTMTEIYLGDISIAQARAAGRLKASGAATIVRDIQGWLRSSIYAGIRPKGTLSAQPIQIDERAGKGRNELRVR